jgi:hypothetical protein
MPADVVVVGSVNADILVTVSCHQRPGETLLGGGGDDGASGKGRTRRSRLQGSVRGPGWSARSVGTPPHRSRSRSSRARRGAPDLAAPGSWTDRAGGDHRRGEREEHAGERCRAQRNLCERTAEMRPELWEHTVRLGRFELPTPALGVRTSLVCDQRDDVQNRA